MFKMEVDPRKYNVGQRVVTKLLQHLESKLTNSAPTNLFSSYCFTAVVDYATSTRECAQTRVAMRPPLSAHTVVLLRKNHVSLHVLLENKNILPKKNDFLLGRLVGRRICTNPRPKLYWKNKNF